MNRIIFVCIMFLYLSDINAANWFVKPSATGENNGTDWVNAWQISTITFASISGGDIIYISGGNYTENLVLSNSFNIETFIIRARSTNADCISANGWLSTYDSQCTFTNARIVVNGANNITVDGVVSNGIYLISTNTGSYSQVEWTGDGSNIKLKYIKIQGAGYQINFGAGSTRGIDITPGSGVSTNILIDHCEVLNMPTFIQTGGTTNVTIQHSELHHGEDTGTQHENVWYIGTGTECVLRWSIIHHHGAEGFFLALNGSGINNKCYGNVFYSGGKGFHIRDGGTYENTYCYNNTFVSLSNTAIENELVGVSGQAKNNLIYNCTIPVSNLSTNTFTIINNWIDSENGNIDPFVNSVVYNYHIISNNNNIISGVTLLDDPDYSYDLDGKTRNETWTVGAYEYYPVAPPQRYRWKAAGMP